jgi:predicted enzyme related to lactoylglutathione lyase
MKFSIQLQTNSISETVNFYKEHLGLNFEILRPDFFAIYHGNNYQIQFQLTENKPVTDGVCLFFTFEDAKELYEKLVEKRLPVNIHEHPSETFNFDITDNNGYKICITSQKRF